MKICENSLPPASRVKIRLLNRRAGALTPPIGSAIEGDLVAGAAGHIHAVHLVHLGEASGYDRGLCHRPSSHGMLRTGRSGSDSGPSTMSAGISGTSSRTSIAVIDRTE